MINEPTQFAPPRTLRDSQGDHAVVSYGTDDGLIVEFFIKPLYMEYLSEQMGHPIFQDRVMTRIIAPGNNKTVWEHGTKGIDYETQVDPDTGEYHTKWEVRDQLPNGDVSEPRKYPKAWARFEKKAQPSDMGWPIEECGFVTRSMAESLKMLGIPTVEALAGLTDTNAQGIMGGYKFRNLAKAALDEQSRNKIVATEQSRADRAEEQNKLLKTEVEGLKAMVDQMQANYTQLAGSVNAPLPQSIAAPQAVKAGAARQSARTKRILENKEAAA